MHGMFRTALRMRRLESSWWKRFLLQGREKRRPGGRCFGSLVPGGLFNPEIRLCARKRRKIVCCCCPHSEEPVGLWNASLPPSESNRFTFSLPRNNEQFRCRDLLFSKKGKGFFSFHCGQCHHALMLDPILEDRWNSWHFTFKSLPPPP
ncbi:hypothetical protein CEXT_681191 [Caerostris extrusa]|uniref:Uncharacterized protein n=1 Tax=Caerostris extrusa TaxID=172846 RepID=A0AAV4RBX3_CAEEX|nr:hypothetical protein CEXT_681191 [Caerostris extrusa]